MSTTTESPLKRLQRPTEFKSRFTTDFERILSGTPLPANPSFFNDFFCLDPKPKVIEQLVQQQTASTLLARRGNLQQFFEAVIHVLRDKEDQSRRLNALQCLLSFLRQLLKKSFPNDNFDLISILCGSLEQSDQVLSNFVAALDESLADESAPPQLRHRALQVILVMTCQIGQGSLVSYFLRRDFFFTLCSFITSSDSLEMQLEAQVLLGALANYHKFETRNMYLMRLEDLVEDHVMRTIITNTTQALKEGQQRYIDIEDDAPPSFAATLTSLVTSLRLSEYFSASSPSKGATPSAGERAFVDTPPPSTCLLLLPFYDLLNRNKLFLSIALEPSLGFAPTFLSFASYALCHASTSSRAKGYGRLCLITMTRLVEDAPPAIIASEDHAAQVRLCRQRKPQLAFVNDQKRPLMCAILDDALIYMRHNIQKQLDVESHLLAVKLIHKSLHSLHTGRIRLQYDWVPIWRGLAALGAFVINKIDQLRALPMLDDLIAQLLITLDYACLYSDALFANPHDPTMLYYEILRAESVIKDLGDLTGASGLQPSLSSSTSSSATLHGAPGSPADQSLRNLKAVVAHFSSALDEHQQNGEVMEAEKMLAILDRRTQEEGLDLVESTSFETMRHFDEAAHETGFKLLCKAALQDALEVFFDEQII